MTPAAQNYSNGEMTQLTEREPHGGSVPLPSAVIMQSFVMTALEHPFDTEQITAALLFFP